MLNRRESIKREILTNIKSVSILIIVIILLYNGFSITKLLNRELTDELAWALDFGIYNAVLGILYSVIYYQYLKNKILIKTELLNKKDESNSIILDNEQPQSIMLKICIEGKKRHIPENIKVVFPHWVDIQLKPQRYIKEERNTVLIDVNYLIDNRNTIESTNKITIDLIRVTDETNQENVKPWLELGYLDKFTKIDYIYKGINIRVK